MKGRCRSVSEPFSAEDIAACKKPEQCVMCRKDIAPEMDWYRVNIRGMSRWNSQVTLCSDLCFTEWAWALRETSVEVNG